MMMMAMMDATIKASDDGDGKRRPDDISPFRKSILIKLCGKRCDTAKLGEHACVDVSPPPRGWSQDDTNARLEYYMFFAQERTNENKV